MTRLVIYLILKPVPDYLMKTKMTVIFLILLFFASTGNSTDIFQEIAGEFSGIPPVSGKLTVTVFPFETVGTVDAKYGVYISEKIVHELVALKKCTVVERTKIARVLTEQELSMSGALKSDTLDKIGRLLSVDVLIVGTVSGSRGQMEILARAIDVRTGSVIKSVSRSLAPASIPEKELPVSTRKAARKTAPVQGIVDDTELSHRLHYVQVFRSGPRSYYVIGLIENTGAREINKPALTISLLNNKKEQVGVAQAFADRNIFAGETLPFRGFLKDGPVSYNTFEIVYEPQEKLFNNYVVALTGSQMKLVARRLGSLITYNLTGCVQNPNDHGVSYPSVIVSFYDNKNVFIGSGTGYCTIKKLGPGKTTPFSVMVYSTALNGKPVSYRLQFSGLWTR